MTSAFVDPLAPRLMAVENRVAADPQSDTGTLRPFGLTFLTEVAPTRVRDISDWTYDSERQLNVTGDGRPVIMDMRREPTHNTEKTVADHQEWDDITPD